jgi:hypothetical protein
VEVAGRSSSDCELYNVLRYSSAYRITLVESEAYEEIVPLRHTHPEETPLSKTLLIIPTAPKVLSME